MEKIVREEVAKQEEIVGQAPEQEKEVQKTAPELVDRLKKFTTRIFEELRDGVCDEEETKRRLMIVTQNTVTDLEKVWDKREFSTEGLKTLEPLNEIAYDQGGKDEHVLIATHIFLSDIRFFLKEYLLERTVFPSKEMIALKADRAIREFKRRPESGGPPTTTFSLADLKKELDKLK